MPKCSMVLEYLPTFARTKSPSYVGKYTSTMEHMESELNISIPHDPLTFVDHISILLLLQSQCKLYLAIK